MQTVEFSATVEDGIIHIPETYRDIIPEQVKVILTDDFPIPKKMINFNDIQLNTEGLKFSREEANDW